MTRDERQEICIQKWKKSKGKGTIQAATGFGKTRISLNLISRFIDKKPNISVIIIVPTLTLKEQWETSLGGLNSNCQVFVINTAIKNIYQCDFLILDELHRYGADTFSQIFKCIGYKYILGLTATFERLDGKHEIMNQYCPVCDTITLLEATANGWVSPYNEYLVLIEVDDIEEYNKVNTTFNEAFEFFDYDFSTAMSCIGPEGWKKQLSLRDKKCHKGTEQQRSDMLKNIKIMSAQFMRALQARKKFINNHPKKLEIARKIIENRSDSKIITFSNNISMAESIGYGLSYSGRDTKKKGRATLEQIRNGEVMVLNTVKRAIEGLSIDDISIAINLGIDSSKTKAIQKTGRVIRFEEGKKAEVFNIIINDTVELSWFANSHKGLDFKIIDEEGLEKVLKGEEPKPYKKKIKQFMFRF